MVGEREISYARLSEYNHTLFETLKLWEHAIGVWIDAPIQEHEDAVDRLETATDKLKENIIQLISGLAPDNINEGP